MEESNSREQTRCPCGFWGSDKTQGLCSKCYRDNMDKSNDPLKPPRPLDSKSDYAPSTTATHSHSRNGRSSADLVRGECSGLSSSSVSLTNIPSSNSAFKGPDNVSKISDCDISRRTDVDKNCDSVGKNTKDSVSVQTDNSVDNNKVSVITTDNSNILPQTDNKTSNTETERKGTKRDSSVLVEEEKPSKPVQKNKKRCFKCSSKLELAQREIGKCRCNYIFCPLHRLPEEHSCLFDHKEDGRREAREKMIKPTRHLGTSFKRLDSA